MPLRTRADMAVELIREKKKKTCWVACSYCLAQQVRDDYVELLGMPLHKLDAPKKEMIPTHTKGSCDE